MSTIYNRNTRSALFALLTLLLGAFSSIVHASPTGASGCVGGAAAVGNAHLNVANVKEGTLDDGGIIFTIGDYVLANGSAVQLPVGQNLTWQLNATKKQMRGFLVRAEDLSDDNAVDTTVAFMEPQRPRDGFKVAETVCIATYSVGGVTHVGNKKKKSVSGVFRMDEVVDELQLDVTVVIKNRDNSSVFYYSGFVVSMVDEGDMPKPSGGDDNKLTEPPMVSDLNGDPVVVVDAVNEDEEKEGTDVADTPGFFGSNAADRNDDEENNAGFFDLNGDPTVVVDAVDEENEGEDTGNGNAAIFDPALGLPLILRGSACTVDKPCGMCEGDCNKNAACEEGLECFFRPDETSVPGCSGAGVAGKDYCYKPQNGTLRLRGLDCSKGRPCDACQGVCESDDDCMDGLACFIRNDTTPVPGCKRAGVSAHNYCYAPGSGQQQEEEKPDTVENDRKTLEPTSIATTPSTERPKEARPTNTQQEVAESIATTEEPSMSLAPKGGDVNGIGNAGGVLSTREEPCNPQNPCDECVGDCDANDECAGDLQCFFRTDMESVPSCVGSGVPGRDYCAFNPAMKKAEEKETDLPAAARKGVRGKRNDK